MIKSIAAAVALIIIIGGLTVDARAQGYNLEGPWTCVARCQIPGGRMYIEQRGRGLTLINEVRQVSRGYLANPFTIVATDWNLTGRISRDGGTIFWANGSRWAR